MKLEKLTPEQELKMQEVKQYWLDYIFSCKQSVNKPKVNIQIEWLYKFCGLKKPVIIYLDSPMGAQVGANYLKYVFENTAQVGDQVWDQVRAQVGDQVGVQVWAQVRDQVRAQVGAQVRDQVRAQVRDQVRAQVRDQVWAQVWAQVRDQVRAQVWAQVWAQVGDQVGAQVGDQVGDQVGVQVRDQVRAQVRDQKLNFESFASYGSVTDYGWVSFYDFFTQIGVINNDRFNEFKSLIQCGIYDTIQLNGFCIVVDMPNEIHRNKVNRLHCDNGPAIKFKDGYGQYYWNGVSVPEPWIMRKESITSSEILKETNAEKRRCLREILGVEKYFKILGGVVLIDEDIDDLGNEMQLFRSKKKDDLLGEYIQFLKVICPSTKREYLLYPPDQKSKNVWGAKASTFRNEKVKYRHGDVALLDLNKEYERPILES